MIWHHPAIGQVHVFLELDCDHLWIDLYDRARKPITDAFSLLIFVVAQHLDPVPDFVSFPLVGRACEI
jgi:hypothetical protein